MAGREPRMGMHRIGDVSRRSQNHLNIVESLHENRDEGCFEDAFYQCAERGHLDVMKFFHEHEYEFDEIDLCTMDIAAESGHLHVAQWLHENRAQGCTTQAVDGAAGRGHLEVVKFLLTNRAEGCTTKAMDQAAANGHIEIVR